MFLENSSRLHHEAGYNGVQCRSEGVYFSWIQWKVTFLKSHGNLKKKKKTFTYFRAGFCLNLQIFSFCRFAAVFSLSTNPPAPLCCQPPLLRERLSGGITETLCDLSLDIIGSGGAMIQLELGQLRARGARRAGQAGCVKGLLE